jgi:hypothetical protein
MSVTRCDAPGGLCLPPGRTDQTAHEAPDAARFYPEHCMSDEVKLGLILLFVVFALMVIGPVVAG